MKIAIAGLKRDLLEEVVKASSDGRVTIIPTTDIEAAQYIATGQADAYIGACNSGSGAALSMLIGMLGSKKCKTVAGAGEPVDNNVIKNAVSEGRVAFGVAIESINNAVPQLVKALLEK